MDEQEMRITHTHARKIHAGGGTKYRNIIRKGDAIERG